MRRPSGTGGMDFLHPHRVSHFIVRPPRPRHNSLDLGKVTNHVPAGELPSFSEVDSSFAPKSLEGLLGGTTTTLARAYVFASWVWIS